MKQRQSSEQGKEGSVEQKSPSSRLLNFLGRFPLAVLYGLSNLGFVFLYHVRGYRRGVVRANLARAFPDWNAKELTVIEKKFYRGLSDLAVEIARARFMPREAFRRRVSVENPEVLLAASADFSRPVMLLTLHQGNWEWLLHSAAHWIRMPLVPLYKPLHDASVDQFIFEMRSRFGAIPVPVKNAPRYLLRRQQEPRCIIALADQAPVPEERSADARFFGATLPFHAGAVRLARRAGYAVLFVACQRKSRGYYAMRFELLAENAGVIAQSDLVDRYARAAEAAIRRQPESWLWSNRRWKHLDSADGQ